MKILVNGQICNAQEAVVSVYDHGFLYGMGLFETFRTYQGRCFLLKEHLERLRMSCMELGIVWQSDEQQVQQQVEQLLAYNNLSDAYVRYSVSAGTAELGLPTGEYSAANTIIYMKELPPYDEQLLQKGRALQKLRTRRNRPEGQRRYKSFHFMNNIVAKRELQSYPWATGAEGLFLNDREQLAEGIVSNIFFVHHRTICTPHLDTGILPGITRAHVIQLAEACGYNVEQGFYTWEQLRQAQEAWITNSIQELVPITMLFDENGQQCTVGDGSAGIVTKQLMEKYRQSTGGLS